MRQKKATKKSVHTDGNSGEFSSSEIQWIQHRLFTNRCTFIRTL